MGKINGKVALFAVLLAVLLLPGVFAAGDVAYTLPYYDPLPPCYNGIKDANETGVDCGPACTRLDVRETCDTIDNDRDCLIDEGCAADALPGGSNSVGLPSAEPLQSCSDGIQNQNEPYIDCGGVCTLNVKEVCYDGLDNNNDCIFEDGCYRECLSDEKGNCLEVIRTSPPDAGSSQPIEQETIEPSTSPEQQPASETKPKSESVPANDALSGEIVSYPERMPSTPAAEADDSENIKLIRQFAKDNKVYIPDNESDADLLDKYAQFIYKHESEFEAKYGNAPPEKAMVELLMQFSDETYPKPVQQQSFFSKVAGFFKKLFS